MFTATANNTIHIVWKLIHNDWKLHGKLYNERFSRKSKAHTLFKS